MRNGGPLVVSLRRKCDASVVAAIAASEMGKRSSCVQDGYIFVGRVKVMKKLGGTECSQER